jgi:hypothetical protein
MKSKDKRKLISYAVNYYNKIFNCNYKPIYKSKKNIESLLKEYPHSCMTCWCYCCCGLYNNCWQDLFEEDNWDMTQDDVNKSILNMLTSELLRKCRTESRMFYCEKDGVIDLLIIARDLSNKEDYFITFSKEKM